MHRTWGLLLVVAACGGDEAPRDADPTTYAACKDAPAAKSGEGTYYDATGAGNCSFDPSPNDLMVAAMNAPDEVKKRRSAENLTGAGQKNRNSAPGPAR